MPSVTVLGANNTPVTVTFSASDAVAAAQSLVSTISSDVQSGALAAVTWGAGTLPPETSAALFVNGGASFTQPQGYNAVVINGAGPSTIIGSAQSSSRVLAGDGALTYVFGAGSSGTIVAGGGNDYITGPSAAGGLYNIILGSGTNVVALQSGHSAIATGMGMSAIALGTSASNVHVGGSAIVTGDQAPDAAHTGADTITAGTGSTTVYGGASDITFLGGSGTATVQGAGGSATVFARGTTGLFISGRGGNSLVVGGATSAQYVANSVSVTGQILVGQANGDQLIAGQAGASLLFAGPGNETLDGALSNGNNLYYAGNNAVVNGAFFYASTQIATGSGSSTVFGGTGYSTVTAGPGPTTYEFVQGVAGGGVMTITNFNPAKDSVRLYGYMGGTAAAAVAAAQVNPGATNGTVVTLTDNTRILFQGYTGGFNGNSFA